MTITNLTASRFLEHLTDEEKSAHTTEKYMRDVRAFIRWLGESEADKSAVLAYKKELCETYAPASVNSMLSSLNALFSFLGRHDLRVKTLKIQRRIFADRDRELTKAEYDRLLTAAKDKQNERLYLLMQTIGSTGIRISELRHITVEAIRAGRANVSCKGKLRPVILPSDLCKILAKYAKRRGITSGPVFVTRTGKPLDRSTVWKMMKALCEAAGVPRAKVFPHNLRHLFARTFYSIQKDIVRLADILGHTSINTTRIYTMESGEVHRRQIQMLGMLRL